MNKISAHFDLREFVPKSVYDIFGDSSIQFIDPRIINLAEFYRSYFGKAVTVNTWSNGGAFKERGFREPNTTTGAMYSQHKMGRAFDCNVDGITPNEMYIEILKKPQPFIERGLTTLESISYTTGWLHSDCRNVQGFDVTLFTNGVLIVKP
jgi:hypothetical protein